MIFPKYKYTIFSPFMRQQIFAAISLFAFLATASCTASSKTTTTTNPNTGRTEEVQEVDKTKSKKNKKDKNTTNGVGAMAFGGALIIFVSSMLFSFQ